MSIRQSFFRKFGLSIFGVFLLNGLATFFFWYESFPWFDMLMHFLGGVVVTFFAVFLFYKSYTRWRSHGNSWKIITLNIIVLLIVAVLWEIMEFSVQHAFNVYGVLATPEDSISDIILGLTGSLVALLYYFMKTNYERN